MCCSDNFCHNLFTFLNLSSFVCLGVNSEPPCFFITTSKILMRLNVVFLEGLQPQIALMMLLFSIKCWYLLTTKTTPDVNNFPIFTWYEIVTVCSSLHVRATFDVFLWPQLSWCSMYKLRHSFLSKIYKKYQSSLF